MNKLIIYALLAICGVAPVFALVSTMKASHRASVARIQAIQTIRPHSALEDSFRESDRILAETKQAAHKLFALALEVNRVCYEQDQVCHFVYVSNRTPANTIIETKYEPTVTRTTNGWEIRFKE